MFVHIARELLAKLILSVISFILMISWVLEVAVTCPKLNVLWHEGNLENFCWWSPQSTYLLLIEKKCFHLCLFFYVAWWWNLMAQNVSDLLWRRHNDSLIDMQHQQVKWSLTKKLLKRLIIAEVTKCLHVCCLRWYRHMTRSNTCINKITSHSILFYKLGTCGQGRLRKTWSEYVKEDLKNKNRWDVIPHDGELAKKNKAKLGVAHHWTRENGNTRNTKTGW